MNIKITMLVLSLGLLWGCQDKHKGHDHSESAKPKPMAMDQKMDGKMDQGHSSMEVGDDVAYYTCPMPSHSHINSTEPGSCTECGMALVAALEVTSDEADYFGCPMPIHSHVRSDDSGQCPECGMNLKPYKLSKP